MQKVAKTSGGLIERAKDAALEVLATVATGAISGAADAGTQLVEKKTGTTKTSVTKKSAGTKKASPVKKSAAGTRKASPVKKRTATAK